MSDLSCAITSHSICFEFSRKTHAYSVPLTINGARPTAEFFDARRSEVILCMQQLAKRTAEINIASKEGVSEFSLANELVKYYFFALAAIDREKGKLFALDARKDEEQKRLQQVYMYEATRERTR